MKNRNSASVIFISTAIAASLSLSLSACKKRQATGPAEHALDQARSENAAAPASTLTPQELAQQELLKNNGAQTPAATSPTQTGQMASTSAGATPPAAVVVETPKEAPVTCFLETFKHKRTAGHDSAEACSHHKNLVSVSHSSINTKSVCVRVNNVPVKYEHVGKSTEFMIGSIAGPDATITVRYCTGQTSCETAKKDDCQVPKDEFMDAIGGGDPESGNVAQWENTNTDADAKLNNDVKRELADIDDSAPDDHSTHVSVFKDWIGEKAAPACGKKQSS